MGGCRSMPPRRWPQTGAAALPTVLVERRHETERMPGIDLSQLASLVAALAPTGCLSEFLIGLLGSAGCAVARAQDADAGFQRTTGRLRNDLQEQRAAGADGQQPGNQGIR
jgi:hypothetical protein